MASDVDLYERVNPETPPTPGYFLDMYGTCSLGPKCLCLKPEHGWYGRHCPQWKPAGWRSHEDMLKFHQERQR